MMVDRCCARLGEAGHLHATATVMNAEELTFSDGRFDAVLCGFGVFFLTEPTRALRSVRHVLTASGRLAFTIFDGPVLWEWLNPTLLEFTPPPHPQPHPMWTADGAARVLADAGFDSVEVHHISEDLIVADVDVLWSWLWALGSRMLLERMDAPTLEALRGSLAGRLEEHRYRDACRAHQSATVLVAIPG